MPRITDNNATTLFTTGEAAFADIGERLELDGEPNGIAYLLAWSVDKDVVMQPSSSVKTAADCFTAFNKAGGSVYAMVWNNTFSPFFISTTADGISLVNGLSKSKAILDKRTPLAGTHHQKIQGISTLKNGAACIAWCGGMDLFKDRIGPDALHDVHCRVVGEAAVDLINVFLERWNDHPDHGTNLAPQLGSPGGLDGHDQVQVCRTYPMFAYSTIYSLLLSRYGSYLYSFAGTQTKQPGDMRVNGQVKFYGFYDASKGVQQTWRAVRKAIRQAANFIYLEDQYLTNKWIGDELARQLTANKNLKLVILALHPDKNTDIEQMWPRRREVLASLQALDPQHKRWQVFYRRLDKPSSYVHSKTWIFDDELIVTGSANADRRGYTYNSEADIVIAGDLTRTRASAFGATTVAQDLRCRLFAKHLGGQPKDYLDWKSAIARWWGPLQSTNVAVFNPSQKPGPPDQYAAKLQAAASGPPSPQQSQASGAILALQAYNHFASLEDCFWNDFEDPDDSVPVP